MAVIYAQVEALTAHMVNAVFARNHSEAEINYTTLPVPSSVYQNPRFPQSVVRDQILIAELEIIKLICCTDKHPQRTSFYDFTGNLASGGKLPVSIGPYGDVRTVGSKKPLDEAAPRSSILRWNRQATVSYNFAIQSDRIYHAADENIEIEAATFELAARSLFTGTDTTDNRIRLQDEYLNLLAAKALSFLPLKDAYNVGLAGMFGQYVLAYFAQIAQGGTSPAPVFPTLPAE
jgi:hypothetical protein